MEKASEAGGMKLTMGWKEKAQKIRKLLLLEEIGDRWLEEAA